ncbi:MAG: hypothetical protein KF682_18200, partial [Nitrospira sp.]|nr:hypothetical protein [Nitrospira sp.]
RVAVYLEDHWGLVPFTPILYLFIWGATIRIILENLRPIRFENIGPHIYETWCGINIFAPILMLFVWVMMYKGGKARVLGLWLRLGTDAALFSAMLTYHIADGRYPNPGAKVSENHLFARYLVASILIFMLTLIIRDWWAIAVNVYKANRIRRVRQH